MKVSTFTALKYRNYRFWYFGQLVSLFGTWMQNTAQSYLIYELTQSSAYLGYVTFFMGAPTWVFTLYGGVIADRMSRRKLLMITQTVMMVLAFLLAAITFLGVVKPWHILVLAGCLGIATAFDVPARLALIPELVEMEDLTNAIALNATMFNAATILGPAAGGIIYALYGPGWCFIINGLTFIAILLSLYYMRLERRIFPNPVMSTFAELKEGLSYVVHHTHIRSVILLLGLITIFGLSFLTLIPAWAVDILHGDSRTSGYLLSARGVGALISALFLASLGRKAVPGKMLTYASFLFPLMLICFALFHTLFFSILTMVGVGASLMLILNLINSIIQTLTSDKLRGRVMSVHGLTFFGCMPIAGLLAGFSAEIMGEPLTVLAGAAVLMVAAVLIQIVHPALRSMK